MIVYINNNIHNFSESVSISEALNLLGINASKGIAVAVNNKVITKSQWNTFLISENDKITLIRPTQGG